MRTFLQTLLACVTLGMVSLGCGKQEEAQVAPTDVTLKIPSMN